MYIDCERGQLTKGKGFKSKTTVHKLLMTDKESDTGIDGDESNENDDAMRRW